MTFDGKADARSTVTVEHARLAGAEQAEASKQWWRERLSALKAQLEGDRVDA